MFSRFKYSIIEDAYNTIWECKESRFFWKHTKYWETIKSNKERDPLLFLNQIKSCYNRDELELFSVISWHLWSIRNKSLLGEKKPSPADLLEWCHKYWDHFSKEKPSNSEAKAVNRRVKWDPPPPGLFKINTDAGQGSAGDCWNLAAVARDGTGMCVGVRSARIHRPVSPLAAELLAIKEGLLLGAELVAGRQSEPSFWVESDCLQAVSEVSRPEVACSDREATVLSLKVLMADLSCKGVKFVPREANRLAHSVAKSTLSLGGSVDRSGNFPIEAWPVLMADMPSPCIGIVVPV